MSEPSEAEFDLSSLNDEELIEQVHDDLYNGLQDRGRRGDADPLERGWSAEKVLNNALVEGMRIVGIDFRDGILFVPEVLLAANSMKGGMEILRPLLAETGVEPIGKIVIGTVKGDIHDIGKNLVSMMLEGAGFEVIDLGINNPVEKYLAALEQHQARHSRHVGAADHDHALHESRHRHAEGEAASATTTSCWSAARRSTRSSARRSAPTPIAATPRWRSRPQSDCWPRARSGAAWRTEGRCTADAAVNGQGMLIIACGALAHEIMALRRANGWGTSRCVPAAELHNRPQRIPRRCARRFEPRADALQLDLRRLRRLRHGRRCSTRC